LSSFSPYCRPNRTPPRSTTTRGDFKLVLPPSVRNS
jgi:hypothetical protein